MFKTVSLTSEEKVFRWESFSTFSSYLLLSLISRISGECVMENGSVVIGLSNGETTCKIILLIYECCAA